MQLRPYQNAALKAIQEEFDSGVRSTLLVLPTGTGKCLGRGTPVLLYDGGIRKVEHIRPGDLLMGPDSLPRRVLSICRGEEEMFRIVPTKGDPYIVNRSHILSLKLTGEKSRYSRKGQIVNLSVEEYLQKSNHFKHIAKGWRTGVEFRERPVGLDPYLLGAWLGDGSIRSPAITTADDEIVDALIDAAVASKCTIAVQKGRSGKAATYSVSGPITGRSLNKVNRFREWLNNYGLLGCPEKHIPELYKANSRKVQLEVLAGLMDSDGHLTTGGFDYISKSKRLAEDVVFVARSVGLAAYMTECIKGCWYGGEYKTGTYHRVSISGDCSIIPTRIPRKKCPPRRQKKNVLVTGIKVESIGMGEYFGFELDGDGLFLLGDFTVTHNTVVFTSFAAAVRERSQKPVLVLAHRTELVEQAARSLYRRGLVPKIEKAEQSATGYYDAVVASVQTLSRPNRLAKFPRDHFGLIVTDECFTGDTEILTEAGFVRFDELPRHVRVAQFDAGSITFVLPDEYIERPYRGQLVHLHSDQLSDLLMTPRHELLLHYPKSPPRKVAVKDATFSPSVKMKVAGSGAGSVHELTAFERLMIALQADGHLRRTTAEGHSIEFHLSKERKITRLIDIFESSGFRWSEVKGSKARGNVKAKRRFIMRGLPTASKDLHTHFNLSEMSAKKAREIIAEAVEWDGHRYGKNCLYYSSTCKMNADFYQAVAILAGYKTRIITQDDNRSESFSRVYRLFISPDRDYITTQRLSRDIVDFAGTVHCVRVPSGNIVVRRNGMPLVVGNCHHAPGATYRAIYDHFRDTPHLGVTATPNRHDEIGLKNIFQSCAFQYSIKQAIIDGWLVPVRGQQIAVESLHLEELKIVAGDFSQPEIDAMLRQEQTLQEMVVPTIEYAKDRPTIVFTPSVAHAHEIAACFNRLGAKAVAIDGSMPADERAKRLKSYEAGESQFLVNVGVVVEGYDHPPTACIALFRPTKSLGLFAQMCLDDHTEVLTKAGWRTRYTIRDDDEAAAFDLETGGVSWSPILSRTDRPKMKAEEMYGIRSPSLDIRVTGGHKMAWRSPAARTDQWNLSPAEALAQRKSEYLVPVSGIEASSGVPLSKAELEFIGWFMTDGSLNKKTQGITIHQDQNSPYLDDIKGCLQECGFKFSVYREVRKTQYSDSSTIVKYHVSKGRPRGSDKHLSGWGRLEPYIDKNLPPSLDAVTPQQLEVLLEAMFKGDGLKKRGVPWVPQTRSICTGNRVMADRLQSLCVRRGYRCNIFTGDWNRSPIFILHIKAQTVRHVGGSGYTDRPTLSQTTGAPGEPVWCIEVSTGAIITRRNGKVAIMGNCGRGTRLSPGKSDCIILDFVGVGNTVRTVTVMDVLDGTKLSDKEHEKAQELQAAGKNSLEALDEAKQYVANLDSVRAKMRALTTSNAFDVLSMFAVPSAKGLYGGDPATERQIAYLTRVGIKCPPDLEKGEASKLIEALIDRQESGLATFKQIRYLKKLGVTHPDIDAWSFKQASEEINARVNARGFAQG